MDDTESQTRSEKHDEEALLIQKRLFRIKPFVQVARDTSSLICDATPQEASPRLIFLLFYSSSTSANDALRLTGRQLRQQALRTLAVRCGRNLGRASAALGNTLVLLTHLLRNTARLADSSSVTVVGVDAHQVRSNTVYLDVLDDNIARATVASAVAAAAVDLADVGESGVLDGDGSAAVVLDDLVFGRVGSAALPEDVAAAESGDGVYSWKVDG